MKEPDSFLRFLKLEELPVALFAIVVALVVARLSTGFFDRLGERFTRRRLVFKQLAAITKFGILDVHGMGAMGAPAGMISARTRYTNMRRDS